MSAETDWVTTIAAAVAAVTSVCAAIAAVRSASAADKSTDLAAKTILRSAMRELISGANELIEEELRIKSLLIDLTSELTTLSVFSGSFQNSGIELLKQQFENDAKNVAEKTIDAKAIVSAHEGLIDASLNDIDLRQAKIEACRSDLRTIRESMLRELERIRSQNLQRRGNN